MTLPSHPYPSLSELLAFPEALGGRVRTIGESIEGRPIRCFEHGPRGAPTVLFTGLMHGMEIVGGLGLIASARAVLRRPMASPLRLLLVPVVNPDAVVSTLERGRARRTNARGVDLNRNFAVPAHAEPSWHPFSGSRLRGSPHYRGETPWSEPETRALRDLVLAERPLLALGFHSIGGLVLHPSSCSKAVNPRAAVYAELGAAFARAQRAPYRVMPGRGWYPTLGDLDDWVEDAVGALALTIEVGRRSALREIGLRLVDPFWWMNPVELEPTLHDVARGTAALVERALNAARAPEPSSAIHRGVA